MGGPGKLAKADHLGASGYQVLQPLHGRYLGGGAPFGKLHRLGIGQQAQGGRQHGLILGQDAPALHLCLGKADKSRLALSAGFFRKRCGLLLGSIGLLAGLGGLGFSRLQLGFKGLNFFLGHSGDFLCGGG